MLLQQKNIVFNGDTNGVGLSTVTSFTNDHARLAPFGRSEDYCTPAKCLPGDADVPNRSFVDAALHLKKNVAKSSLLVWRAECSFFYLTSPAKVTLSCALLKKLNGLLTR